MPRTLKGAAGTAQAEGFHRCRHISRARWDIVNTDCGAARGCAGAVGRIRSAWHAAHGSLSVQCVQGEAVGSGLVVRMLTTARQLHSTWVSGPACPSLEHKGRSTQR